MKNTWLYEENRKYITYWKTKIIQHVTDYKYIGSKMEGNGITDKEIDERVGKQEQCLIWWTHF